MRVYGATGFKPGPQSRGIRPGRLTAPPTDPVPDGAVHAIDEDGRALCGLVGLKPVFDEPVEWGSRSLMDHCRACEAAAADTS